MTDAKLSIHDLRIAFGARTVVDLERLELGAGEILGLAGESGSGKSITALAVLGLAATLGARVEGSVRVDGEELVGAPESRLREIRGSRIATIFQSPVSSLDPLLQVGELFQRTLRLHGVDKREAAERAAGAFREVLLSPDLLARYQHELSGAPTSSSPSSRTLPSTRAPSVDARPSTASAVIDLPEPLSPARPRISPAPSSRRSRSTTVRAPNAIRRSWIESFASVIASSTPFGDRARRGGRRRAG